MAYYRRRSFRRSYSGGGRRRKSSGGRVRRELKASIGVTASAVTTSTLAIPVDSTRNVGINIHGMNVEWSIVHPTADHVDTEQEWIWLNRNTPTVERNISDVDCICKVGHAYVKHGTPANAYIEPLIMQEVRMYPPVPIFQDEIKLCSYADAGVSTKTAYVVVVYTLAWMTVGQIMGISKNIII